MALILCPDCSRKVSDAAIACPDCARPIATLDGVLRAAAVEKGGGAKLRGGRRSPGVTRPPLARAEAEPDRAADADRLPAPTFAVACSACKNESILLYPHPENDYVCLECEEQSLLRGWAWQLALQRVPIAIFLVVILAVAALVVWNINTHPPDRVVPHSAD